MDYLIKFQRELNELKSLLEKVEYLLKKYSEDDLSNWETAEVFYSIGLKVGELLKKIIKRCYIVKFGKPASIEEMTKEIINNTEIIKIIRFRDTLAHSYYELRDYKKALYNQLKRIKNNEKDIKVIISFSEELLP